MAEKPKEFVDLIREATQQRRRATAPLTVQPAAKPRSSLSNWPRQRQIQWRLETLMPWKIKPWLRKD